MELTSSFPSFPTFVICMSQTHILQSHHLAFFARTLCALKVVTTVIWMFQTRIFQSRRLTFFFNSHNLRNQSSKGDLKAQYSRPEVSSIVEVCQFYGPLILLENLFTLSVLYTY